MGDPATPSPADRAATRELVKRIVEAVRNDERIDLGIGYTTFRGYTERVEYYTRTDVEKIVLQLAQEIELVADDVEKQKAATRAAWASQHQVLDVAQRRAVENENLIGLVDALRSALSTANQRLKLAGAMPVEVPK